MEAQGAEPKKIIRIFAAASFLNDLGSDIIYPIWPLFVTNLLKANMTALGLLDGIGEALVSLSQAASGYLSDRIKKRKVFIWTGYLLGALSRIGYSVSSLWTHLIPFRVLDRVGKIRGAPRDAIVADISTEKNRGKYFGLLRTMDNLGAACGIIICILFFSVAGLGYRVLFALAAVPSLLSVLLILSSIREPRAGKIRIYRGMSLRDLDKNFRLFLVSSAFYALGAFSYSFLLIYANRLGFRDSLIPVFYLVFTASASLLSFPFGKLSDIIGRKYVLLLSYLFWAGVCLSAVFSQNRLTAILIFLLYGAYRGALEPVQKAFVSDLAPQEFRASCLGGFQMVVGLSALPANVIAGMLWEGVGMLAAFSLSLVLTMVSAILLLFVKKP